MKPTQPFTQAESEHAFNVWGANCGPNAMAFAVQVHIDKVHGMIPDFATRRYTNPTMMRAGLRNMNAVWGEASPQSVLFLSDAISLVRVQWTGPWTAPGANPRWAYRQTHWIATWSDEGVEMAFDCNGGVREFRSWLDEIVPALTASIPRAFGGWHPTHVMRVKS